MQKNGRKTLPRTSSSPNPILARTSPPTVEPPTCSIETRLKYLPRSKEQSGPRSKADIGHAIKVESPLLCPEESGTSANLLRSADVPPTGRRILSGEGKPRCQRQPSVTIRMAPSTGSSLPQPRHQKGPPKNPRHR